MALIAAPQTMAQQAAGEPPAAPAAGAIVLKQHTLTDPGSNSMPSHTVLAPEGWKVEGGGWWAHQNYFKVHPSQDIKITAPDGRRVHIGPTIGATDFFPSPQAMQLGAKRPAEGTADGGIPVLYMPGDLPQWKQWIEQKILPQAYPQARNIRVKEVSVIPELTQMLQRQLAPIKQTQEQQNQQWRMMGMAMHNFADGAFLAASCSYELEGQVWEELFMFGTSYLGTDTEMGRQIWWSIEPNVAYRAPEGQLETHMPLLMTVANSMRMTPQWARMKSDHIAKMNQIAAKGAAERSRIIADSNREIQDIINEGYRDRQASMDRTHTKVINSIRGVEDYTVAGSETTVQLPNHYEHVYSNGDGTYLLTNDSLYDPNTDMNINNRTWERMEAAAP